MDCKTARLLLLFARPLPTELEASEAEALESHLADCPECGALAQAERQTDTCLGQAMRATLNIVNYLNGEKDYIQANTF